jgi:hypothetical protein
MLTSTFATTPRIAASQESEPWVDRNLFPEAYSILSSERLMFPDDVSDLPIKIDSCRQLFIDDYLIASKENLTREFHKPKKHPQNPVIEGVVTAVLYDEDNGKFRLYRRGDGRFRKYGSKQYMESNNGVNWKVPDLGPEERPLFDPPGVIAGIWRNPVADGPEKYYEAVLFRRDMQEDKKGFFLYHSADGLRWKCTSTRPMLAQTRAAMDPGPYSAWGFGDATTFRYDSILKRYICDAKFNLYMPQEKFKQLGIVKDFKPRLRLRTMLESEDLIHWTRPRFYMFPDEHDPPSRQLYFHMGFTYESMWLGMLGTMRLGDGYGGWKQVDIQLTHSRDGRNWSRPRQRQPFIPVGASKSWDADYLGPARPGPVLVGDELWFYYYGHRSTERDKSVPWVFNSGLAKLRRDGFASLNAGKKPGQVITRPMTFKGRSLFINAEVADSGWVKAAVLRRDSKPIVGYTLEEAMPLTKDSIKGAMAWKGEKQLLQPGYEHVRLLFQLKDAKLYSFWIE